MIKVCGSLLLAMLTMAPLLSRAENRVQLDQTTVIDNHELPKITYVIPWQAAQLPAREAPPLDTLIEHALTPLDRNKLRGEIRNYYESTAKPTGSASSAKMAK
jgi:hypothetical protein